jgi:pimeloyl-ACP methyl ester carboxylesterase
VTAQKLPERKRLLAFGALFLIPFTSTVRTNAQEIPANPISPNQPVAMISSTTPAEEEIAFANPFNQNRLSGVLLRPVGAGPIPAVLFIHGGGTADRNTWRPIADEFVKLGFACMLWDKPGCGKSTGDYRTELQQDAMSEAQAALQFIRVQPGIDPKRIGMWGISGAGAIVPQLAAAGDISFAIMVSPMLSLSESLAYASSAQNFPKFEQYFAPLMTRMNISDSEAREIHDFAASFVQLMAKRNVTYDEVLGLLRQRDLNKTWFPKLRQINLITDSTHWTPEYYRRYREQYLHGDTYPLLSQTRCPILIIIGADDFVLDPMANARHCTDAAAKAAPGVITVRTFAGATHDLSPSGEGMAGQSHFVPGYLDLMCSWLKEKASDSTTNPAAPGDSH